MIEVMRYQTCLSAADIASRLRPPDQAPFVFLDSSQVDGQQGRFSIIGRHLWYDCRVLDGHVFIDGEPSDADIWTAARRFLQACQDDLPSGGMPPEFPFTAGLIGYFAYDLAVQLSNGQIQLPQSHDLETPQAWLAAFDQMVVIDQVESTVYLLAWGKLQPRDLAIDQLRHDLTHAQNHPEDAGLGQTSGLHPVQCQHDATFWASRSNFSRQGYCQQIEDVRQAITAGEVYILNLTQRFLLPPLSDPWAIYNRLRAASPTPYAAYLQHESLQILSFSPEQFLQVHGRMVSTRPIKGTRPRGQSPEEDERNRQELLSSPKDRAELLMIVDLERNDLSQVCEPTSVQVSDLFHLETYSTVFHLVATIKGQLADGQDALSCFKACFPGGSITGAPKIRAMQLISEYEQLRRGLYTGCLGYFSLDGQAEFNILIRTIVSDGQTTSYHAGGGITWDSDPKAEYQETLDKASAIGGIFSC